VNRWLKSKGLGPEDFTRERSLEFLAARRETGYTLWLCEKGVAPLLSYLRQVGAAPVPVPPTPATPAERLLEQFRSYLLDERGLSPGSVVSDVHIGRLFLSDPPPEGPSLETLTPADIVAFVKRRGGQRSGAYVTAGLRAFSVVLSCHWPHATATRRRRAKGRLVAPGRAPKGCRTRNGPGFAT
jgi:integrase/recombinase XerD